ncbi:hypothetical protein NQZ68_007542 [Dissostichus eleginoides]|nr:hypothetical protein NQZ68_007542 [Dissostichus eleginoides]
MLTTTCSRFLFLPLRFYKLAVMHWDYRIQRHLKTMFPCTAQRLLVQALWHIVHNAAYRSATDLLALSCDSHTMKHEQTAGGKRRQRLKQGESRLVDVVAFAGESCHFPLHQFPFALTNIPSSTCEHRPNFFLSPKVPLQYVDME